MRDQSETDGVFCVCVCVCEQSQSAAAWVTHRLNLLVKSQLCSFTPQLFSVQHLSWAPVYRHWHFPPAFHGSSETLICYASVAEQQVQPPMIPRDMKCGARLSFVRAGVIQTKTSLSGHEIRWEKVSWQSTGRQTAIFRQEKLFQTIYDRTETCKFFNLYQRVQLCTSDSKQTFIPSHKCWVCPNNTL